MILIHFKINSFVCKFNQSISNSFQMYVYFNTLSLRRKKKLYPKNFEKKWKKIDKQQLLLVSCIDTTIDEKQLQSLYMK